MWREDSTLTRSWKYASLSRDSDAQTGRGMPVGGCVLLIPLPSVSRWRRGSLIHSPFMLDCSREYTMSISEQREGMSESDILAPGGIADGFIMADQMGSDADSHSGPSLNFDILRLVCNCLTDVPDVLSFSLTCSTLREGALQRRLRMSPVVLDLFGMLTEDFHSFIFEDEGGRAPHIYGLKFPNFDYTMEMEDMLERISKRLVDLLEAAIHLEYLSLPTLDFPDVVLDTVEKLTTLRHLSVGSYSYTDYIFTLLATLRSPLEYLSIEAHARFDIPTSFLHHQMAHFASTLEILELEGLTLDIFSISITSPFLALRTLKATYIRPLDQLEVLLRLFPNLDNSLEISYLDRDLTPAVTCPAMRERNKEGQKTHTWPRLDRLACDSDVAFMLALQYPVRRMEIPHVSLPSGAQCLVETLRSNAPRQLLFGLSLFDDLHNLDGLFPFEAVDKLTHLVVFVHIHFEHSWTDCNISNIITWEQALVCTLLSL